MLQRQQLCSLSSCSRWGGNVWRADWLLLLVLALQDEVLIAGFGRRGHAVGDIPGVRFKVRARDTSRTWGLVHDRGGHVC